MASKTHWSNRQMPDVVQQRYGHVVAATLNNLAFSGLIQWKFTGTTHLAVQDVRGRHTLILTTGSSASDPVYKAKYRTALRHWGAI